jgi:hypothetical protein
MPGVWPRRRPSGIGTLVQDMNDKGTVERVTLLWNVADRVYILSGAITPDFAVTIASAVE